MFWFSLQLLCQTFLILQRTERDMIKLLLRHLYEVPVILVVFKWHFTCLEIFQKNTEILNFTKTCLVGVKLFHVDGRIDRQDEDNINFFLIFCKNTRNECNTHAPYYIVMWHAWPYRSFPHYPINGTIFLGEKKLLNTKYVLIFSTTFVWKISHSKKTWARYDQKCILVFM
jgi:hypothetical protein